MCFNDLHYIISDLFHILDGKQNVDIIKYFTPKLIRKLVSNTDSEYIQYTPRPQPKINIRYIDGDNYSIRKGLIDLDDLNKGKVISVSSAVRRVDTSPYRPSEEVRSRDRESHYVEHIRRVSPPPVRVRSRDGRDGRYGRDGRDRGHSAEPPRGRTGYRRGGANSKNINKHAGGTKRKNGNNSNGYPYLSPPDREDERSPRENKRLKQALDDKARQNNYLTTAPQVSKITKEELAKARQDADANLITHDQQWILEKARRATLEREKMQRMPTRPQREDVQTH